MKRADQINQYHKFTGRLMKKFTAEKRHQNIVFSPFSVMMLLAAAADASAGETKQEILRAFGAEGQEEEFLNFMKSLQDDLTKGDTLSSANGVIVRDTIAETIKEEYKKHLTEQFDGELLASANIVEDVNAWVKEKTRGMINEIADDSMKQMLLCLINAIAFEAEWQVKYTDDDAKSKRFYNSDGSACHVKMLLSEEDIYLENEEFTGFVKPYKNVPFAYMALLLEDKESPLDAFEPDFEDIYSNRQNAPVKATMPGFKVSFEDDLTKTCQEMGIRTIFTPGADLSPVTEFPLMADSVIHKAFIEVDQEGTKAAAVTMMQGYGSMPDFDKKYVYIDRPFFFAVVHTETGLPVFVGAVNKMEG